MDVFKKIERYKIVPVTVIDKIEDVIPLGKTLIDAGLPVIEITFRTAIAAEAIKKISEELPELLIGAGTVLTIQHIHDAINAGSHFIVTPGFNPSIVDYCIENSIPIIPGLNSPTFIEWGLERGLNIFKFFPADISGGERMLKALSGPYPQVRFIPTGGVNNSSLVKYLNLENVIACGGSWIVKIDLIKSGKFEKVKELIKLALDLIKK
ncbi:MAG: bifunctional 4-hydroxy-2-oxoglutarate aldolase/2-dehydro-3-deoxy-phosphogluconate aldolase [Candidatus Lokiarchaeota archaeon]